MMIRSLCFCGMGETVARSYPSPLWGGSARSAGVGVAHGSARTIPLLRQQLWMKLRELKGLGFHFRRQAPIGRYIVDFVSFQSRLVIEADGGQHGMPESARSDQLRDAFLQSQGFQVLRFWNSDIDANLEGVMESILGTLKHVPSR